MNRRGNVVMRHRRMGRRARGDRSSALATITAVGKLMIMEATGKFGFLKMGSDVLIGHFL